MCAFKSAVQQTRNEGEEEIQTKFKVEGTAGILLLIVLKLDFVRGICCKMRLWNNCTSLCIIIVISNYVTFCKKTYRHILLYNHLCAFWYMSDIRYYYMMMFVSVFNAVVSASVVEIPAFLKRFLDVKESKDGNNLVLPSTSNKWKRVKGDVRSYAADLLQVFCLYVES